MTVSAVEWRLPHRDEDDNRHASKKSERGEWLTYLAKKHAGLFTVYPRSNPDPTTSAEWLNEPKDRNRKQNSQKIDSGLEPRFQWFELWTRPQATSDDE